MWSEWVHGGVILRQISTCVRLALVLAAAGCAADAPLDDETIPPQSPPAPGAPAPGSPDPSSPDPSSPEPSTPEPSPPEPGAPRSPSQGRVVAYFTAWSVYGRDFHVTDIPAELVTHINYAFVNISPEGECVLGDPYADIDRFYEGDSWETGSLRGSFHQLQLLKERHPHLRTLISIGGWSWSGRFSDVALTQASRQRFATSCVALMERYGFDGIDVDWEFPVSGGLASNVTRPEDRANYTLLLEEMRGQLDTLEGERLLTIAAPAGPAIIENLEAAELAHTLDWINVMTYDFHGGWSPMTNFNAPLFRSADDPTEDTSVREGFNVDAAVQAYLGAGVPPEELVLGVAFYGRGWSGVRASADGLFQPHTGVPMGTWEAGIFDYGDLVASYIPAMTRYEHADAQVPWLYDPDTQVMISYDDPASIGVKTRYARDLGLGGVMFWELNGDDASWSLLHAISDNL